MISASTGTARQRLQATKAKPQAAKVEPTCRALAISQRLVRPKPAASRVKASGTPRTGDGAGGGATAGDGAAIATAAAGVPQAKAGLGEDGGAAPGGNLAGELGQAVVRGIDLGAVRLARHGAQKV